MRVRILGPIEVRTGADAPWQRPPPQQRLVLSMLAAPVGRTRELDAITAAVWGDAPPANAHRLVQALVSRLRGALGQDPDRAVPLRSVGRGWRLELGADELDASRFEELLDDAHRRTQRGDLAGAGSAVEAALALWRGRPFGDLADQAGLVAEAQRLEERRQEALELRARTWLGAGQHGRAIAELKELLVDDPLREQLWALLMVALYRAGRQAEALVTYQRVRERLVDELGVEPGPELQRLHQLILRHDLDGDELGPVPTVARLALSGRADPAPTAVRGLPRPRTTFVGRHAELAALADLLRQHRIVTVVGLGGVGKTRLAIAAAATAADTVAQAAFVDLTRVDAGRLPRAVATALGVVESAHEPLVDTLAAQVRRGPTLLVLDNCEHLLGEVGALVEALTDASHELVVLATSRERIGTPGERVLSVGPMSLEPIDLDAPPDGGRGPDDRAGGDQAHPSRSTSPDALADAIPGPTSGSTAGAGRDEPARSDAARLFLDRLRDARGAEPVDEQPVDQDRVDELCRRLDGLPLAIELAAARASTLGIDGLLSGLDDRLRLLRAAGGGPARHRSLRVVLDWSHDLLAPEEQAALHRLGVFTGSFDLAAASAVAGSSPSGRGEASRPLVVEPAMADLVGRLADKSLLVRTDSAAGSRWGILDTVRDYALEQLDAEGATSALRRRHVHWARRCALDLRDRMVAGGEWREEFRAVEGDLRAALDTSLDTSLDASVEAPPPARTTPTSRASDAAERLDLAFALGVLQTRTGSSSSAQDAYETAIGLARRAGSAEDLARAALGASVSGMTFGVSDRTRVDWLEEALAAQGDEPTGLTARLQARLSMELYWLVDRARSLSLADQALGTARAVADDRSIAHALYASHYTSRGPEDVAERLALSTRIIERAERGGATGLALAGRAAHVVDLLAVGDVTGMDAALGLLWEAADRLQRPAFLWYTDVYRVVLALLEGRYEDADALSATAIAAGRNVAEFSVGLYFAEAISDLRDPAPSARRQRAVRLADMERRFPSVLVWGCLRVLNELALLHPGERTVVSSPRPTVRHDGASPIRAAARGLADRVLDRPHRDAHWVVESCVLAEVAAELADAHLAARLEQALRPFAGRLAVAGRVGACRGAVDHALGLAGLVMADSDQAIEDFRAAADLHHDIGARPHLARSLTALAHALGTRGGAHDDVEAAAVQERAHAVAATLVTPDVLDPTRT